MLRTFIIVNLLLCASISTAQDTPKTDALSVPQLVAQGRRMMKRDSYTTAITFFRKALEKRPKSAVLFNELGVALFQQGAAEAAVNAFKKAVKIDPSLAHAWANMGEAQRRSGRAKKAAVSFHRFLKINRGDPYGLFGMGLAFEGYGNFKKSLKTLEIAEKKAANYPRLLGLVRKAIKRVRNELIESRLPLVQRVDSLIRIGHWAKAVNLLNTGLKKDAGNAQLLGRRGLVLAIVGQLDDAKTDLENAVRLDANEPVAKNAYVLVSSALGIQLTPSMQPDNGHKYLGQDRPALAHKAFTLGLQNKPGDVDYRAGRAEALLRLGRVDAALADFSVIASKPQGAAGQAEAHLLKGDKANATKALTTVKQPVELNELPLWRRSLMAP